MPVFPPNIFTSFIVKKVVCSVYGCSVHSMTKDMCTHV